jgi:hypothetical protein
MYQGLAHRHLMPPVLPMRPLPNGGTLGGRAADAYDISDWLYFELQLRRVVVRHVVSTHETGVADELRTVERNGHVDFQLALAGGLRARE